MVKVEHFIPSNLTEALSILSIHHCYIFAGGTDLMVIKRRPSGLVPNFDKNVLYINNLAELNYIKKDKDGTLHIGATAKYSNLLKSSLVPQLLKDIMVEIASPNIRNMATLVGNVANASPAGDGIVGLYLLNASVELVSLKGSRTVKIKDFIYGVRKIKRERDELIKEIIIPPFDFSNYMWRKVGSRQAESISKVTFLGAYTLENNCIKDIRIAFGSVNTTVVRNEEFEGSLINLSLEELRIKKQDIINTYALLIKPINDQRSTKAYRHKVAMNLLGKFLDDIK